MTNERLKNKSLSELGQELDSRLRDLEGNMELGGLHQLKVKDELIIEMGHVKELAKEISYRMHELRGQLPTDPVGDRTEQYKNFDPETKTWIW